MALLKFFHIFLAILWIACLWTHCWIRSPRLQRSLTWEWGLPVLVVGTGIALLCLRSNGFPGGWFHLKLMGVAGLLVLHALLSKRPSLRLTWSLSLFLGSLTAILGAIYLLKPILE